MKTEVILSVSIEYLYNPIKLDVTEMYEEWSKQTGGDNLEFFAEEKYSELQAKAIEQTSFEWGLEFEYEEEDDEDE